MNALIPMIPVASLSTWWNGFDTAGQFFMGIGLTAGAISLVLLFLTVLGLDHGDVSTALDIGVDADVADGNASLFSTRSITGFFLGFGGGGSIVYERTHDVVLASAAGLVLGVILLLAMYWLAQRLMRLQSDGTIDFKQAVGSTGSVYVTIPPRRAGNGQAQIVFRSRHETINAVTDADAALVAGAIIRVKECLADNLFLVEPV